MSIRYDEANRIFELDTRNTSYRIGIVDEEGFVGHIYYGQKIRPQKCDQFLRTCEAPFVRPRITGRDVHLWIHFRQSIPEME